MIFGGNIIHSSDACSSHMINDWRAIRQLGNSSVEDKLGHHASVENIMLKKVYMELNRLIDVSTYTVSHKYPQVFQHVLSFLVSPGRFS